MSSVDLFEIKHSTIHIAFLCCNVLNVEKAYELTETYTTEETNETVFTLRKNKTRLYIISTEHGIIKIKGSDSDALVEAYAIIKSYEGVLAAPQQEVIDIDEYKDSSSPYVSDVEIERRNIVWETIRKLKWKKEQLDHSKCQEKQQQ